MEKIKATKKENTIDTVCICCCYCNCRFAHSFWKENDFFKLIFVFFFSFPGSDSWLNEYKRLTYNVPMVLTDELKNAHSHQVLHVTFSHNGRMFATCSKDGFVIVSILCECTSIKIYQWIWRSFCSEDTNKYTRLVIYRHRHVGMYDISRWSINSSFLSRTIALCVRVQFVSFQCLSLLQIWNSTYPASIKYSHDMKKFSWKYTQFSQFNQSDTLLLVSGVHFGSPHSTSGEIAVFSVTGLWSRNWIRFVRKLNAIFCFCRRFSFAMSCGKSAIRHFRYLVQRSTFNLWRFALAGSFGINIRIMAE